MMLGLSAAMTVQKDSSRMVRSCFMGSIGNRMKTAECFLNKFQAHSVVFILLPITQSFFPAVSITKVGRESTALAFEP
jgi:hypothetical protein